MALLLVSDRRKAIKYQFQGKQVCKSTFMFINAVGSRHLKNLIKYYEDNGLATRIHKNTKKKTLTIEQVLKKYVTLKGSLKKLPIFMPCHAIAW